MISQEECGMTACNNMQGGMAGTAPVTASSPPSGPSGASPRGPYHGRPLPAKSNRVSLVERQNRRVKEFAKLRRKTGEQLQFNIDPPTKENIPQPYQQQTVSPPVQNEKPKFGVTDGVRRMMSFFSPRRKPLTSADYLTQDGRVKLGLRLANGPTPGMHVVHVVENGIASRAGLKAGDIIHHMGGRQTLNVLDYDAISSNFKGNSKVPIKFRRASSEKACLLRIPFVPGNSVPPQHKVTAATNAAQSAERVRQQKEELRRQRQKVETEAFLRAVSIKEHEREEKRTKDARILGEFRKRKQAAQQMQLKLSSQFSYAAQIDKELLSQLYARKEEARMRRQREKEMERRKREAELKRLRDKEARRKEELLRVQEQSRLELLRTVEKSRRERELLRMGVDPVKLIRAEEEALKKIEKEEHLGELQRLQEQKLRNDENSSQTSKNPTPSKRDGYSNRASISGTPAKGKSARKSPGRKQIKRQNHLNDHLRTKKLINDLKDSTETDGGTWSPLNQSESSEPSFRSRGRGRSENKYAVPRSSSVASAESNRGVRKAWGERKGESKYQVSRKDMSKTAAERRAAKEAAAAERRMRMQQEKEARYAEKGLVPVIKVEVKVPEPPKPAAPPASGSSRVLKLRGMPKTLQKVMESRQTAAAALRTKNLKLKLRAMELQQQESTAEAEARQEAEVRRKSLKQAVQQRKSREARGESKTIRPSQTGIDFRYLTTSGEELSMAGAKSSNQEDDPAGAEEEYFEDTDQPEPVVESKSGHLANGTRNSRGWEQKQPLSSSASSYSAHSPSPVTPSPAPAPTARTSSKVVKPGQQSNHSPLGSSPFSSQSVTSQRRTSPSSVSSASPSSAATQTTPTSHSSLIPRKVGSAGGSAKVTVPGVSSHKERKRASLDSDNRAGSKSSSGQASNGKKYAQPDEQTSQTFSNSHPKRVSSSSSSNLQSDSAASLASTFPSSPSLLSGPMPETSGTEAFSSAVKELLDVLHQPVNGASSGALFEDEYAAQDRARSQAATPDYPEDEETKVPVDLPAQKKSKIVVPQGQKSFRESASFKILEKHVGSPTGSEASNGRASEVPQKARIDSYMSQERNRQSELTTPIRRTRSGKVVSKDERSGSRANGTGKLLRGGLLN
eukprot:g76679.t1